MPIKTDRMREIIESLAWIRLGPAMDSWFLTAHPDLEGDTPAQRIDQGRGEDVLQILERISSGGHG